MAKKDNGKSLVHTTDCLKRSHKDASVFSRFDEALQPIYRTIELSVGLFMIIGGIWLLNIH